MKMNVDMLQKTDEISNYIKRISELEEKNAILEAKNSELRNKQNDLEDDIWSLKFENRMSKQIIQVYEEKLQIKT